MLYEGEYPRDQMVANKGAAALPLNSELSQLYSQTRAFTAY